ncbi:hypothetical protein BEL04_14600 [Mucilaginibacter sp. PPCGB 2223]|uniref:hypothetical protein n=1 Tax=Mucilaginibacter sp. PPCGB 2223 TaxID=1886027 RepID=UPI000824EB47|nr:hypothetical protein [Mucilaginibacter sp. PPCGB 2223]OCX52673.1 hypothetical protein BEL04_14600 [Mucilaginibacter sp. PPCGB 2223]
MKPRLLLLPLVLMLYMAACKKTPGDSETVTFPRKLYISGMGAKGTLRIMTANGDITDPALKAKFLGVQQNYFNVALAPGDTSSITFLKRDTAVFNASKTKYEVYNNEGLFLFSSPDYRVNINGPGDVLYTFLQYTGQYISFPINNGTAYLAKEVDAGHGDYNTITLSVLAYKFTSGPYPAKYQMLAGSVYNEFNLSADLNLGKNDTLAVQGWTVTYKVRSR